MGEWIKLFLLVGALVISTTTCSTASRADANDGEFGYDDYAVVLKGYVNDEGRVNYKQLKARREKLDAFIRTISKLDTDIYEKRSQTQKIAFWINAYNALTLRVIIDNYPIRSSFFRSMSYPRNSIRQIKGVWDKKKFKVMGKDMTLNDIEHKILRKEFNEPRIHIALVCAAIGCPKLRNEPYLAENLEEQFTDQMHFFLADAKKFRIDRRANRVYLSPIFKWFGDDFVSKYGLERKIRKLSRNETAVINFISRYPEKDDTDYLMSGGFEINYLKYDWVLNELSTKDKTNRK